MSNNSGYILSQTVDPLRIKQIVDKKLMLTKQQSRSVLRPFIKDLTFDSAEMMFMTFQEIAPTLQQRVQDCGGPQQDVFDYFRIGGGFDDYHNSTCISGWKATRRKQKVGDLAAGIIAGYRASSERLFDENVIDALLGDVTLQLDGDATTVQSSIPANQIIENGGTGAVAEKFLDLGSALVANGDIDGMNDDTVYALVTRDVYLDFIKLNPDYRTIDTSNVKPLVDATQTRVKRYDGVTFIIMPETAPNQVDKVNQMIPSIPLFFDTNTGEYFRQIPVFKRNSVAYSEPMPFKFDVVPDKDTNNGSVNVHAMAIHGMWPVDNGGRGIVEVVVDQSIVDRYNQDFIIDV